MTIRSFIRNQYLAQQVRSSHNRFLSQNYANPYANMSLGQRIKGGVINQFEQNVAKSGPIGAAFIANRYRDPLNDPMHPMAMEFERMTFENFDQLGWLGNILRNAYINSSATGRRYYIRHVVGKRLKEHEIKKHDTNLTDDIETIDKKVVEGVNKLQATVAELVTKTTEQFNEIDTRFGRLEHKVEALDQSHRMIPREVNKLSFRLNRLESQFAMLPQMAQGNSRDIDALKKEIDALKKSAEAAGGVGGLGQLAAGAGGWLATRSLMKRFATKGVARGALARLGVPGAIAAGAWMAYDAWGGSAQGSGSEGASQFDHMPGLSKENREHLKKWERTERRRGDKDIANIEAKEVYFESSSDITLKAARNIGITAEKTLTLEADKIVLKARQIQFDGAVKGGPGSGTPGKKNVQDILRNYGRKGDAGSPLAGGILPSPDAGSWGGGSEGAMPGPPGTPPGRPGAGRGSSPGSVGGGGSPSPGAPSTGGGSRTGPGGFEIPGFEYNQPPRGSRPPVPEGRGRGARGAPQAGTPDPYAPEPPMPQGSWNQSKNPFGEGSTAPAFMLRNPDFNPSFGEGVPKFKMEGGGEGGGAAYLAGQRQRYRDELNADPATRRKLAELWHAEDKGGKTAMVESLFNRLDLMEKQTGKQVSIKEYLSRPPVNQFYGPIKYGYLGRINDKQFEEANKHIDAALAGSNVIKGRTDQGSGRDPNVRGPGRIAVPGTNEVYNFFGGVRGGHAAAARFASERERAYAEAEARGTGGIGRVSPTERFREERYGFLPRIDKPDATVVGGPITDKFGSMENNPRLIQGHERGRIDGELNYVKTPEGRREFGEFGNIGKLETIRTRSGVSFGVNAASAANAKAFIDDIEGRGYKIKEASAYNPRSTGSGGPSTHGWGTTIDMNYEKNPIAKNPKSSERKTDMPENMQKLGWLYRRAWGGAWKSPTDAMHWEIMSKQAHAQRLDQLVKEGFITPEIAEYAKKHGMPPANYREMLGSGNKFDHPGSKAPSLMERYEKETGKKAELVNGLTRQRTESEEFKAWKAKQDTDPGLFQAPGAPMSPDNLPGVAIDDGKIGADRLPSFVGGSGSPQATGPQPEELIAGQNMKGHEDRAMQARVLNRLGGDSAFEAHRQLVNRTQYFNAKTNLENTTPNPNMRHPYPESMQPLGSLNSSSMALPEDGTGGPREDSAKSEGLIRAWNHGMKDITRKYGDFVGAEPGLQRAVLENKAKLGGAPIHNLKNNVWREVGNIPQMRGMSRALAYHKLHQGLLPGQRVQGYPLVMQRPHSQIAQVINTPPLITPPTAVETQPTINPESLKPSDSPGETLPVPSPADNGSTNKEVDAKTGTGENTAKVNPPSHDPEKEKSDGGVSHDGYASQESDGVW